MSKYYNPKIHHLIENPTEANCDKYELCIDCPVYKKFSERNYRRCCQFFHEEPAEATGLLGYVEVPDTWKIGDSLPVVPVERNPVNKAYNVLVEALYGKSTKSISEAVEEAIGYLGEALE